MKLSDLELGFWQMCLSDYIAERTPRTRTPDMPQCRRLAKEYVTKYPNALARAVETSDGFNGRVIPDLNPPYLAWVRREIPDLLEEPAGMY